MKDFLMKNIVWFCLLTFTLLSAQKFDGLALTPPMGWNSWNTFAADVSEQLIKETAEAMITNGMLAAGYRYIVVDDGWEAIKRDAQGNLVAAPEKFPGGMKALGDYLHSKGFKFGIHNDAGTATCNGLPGGRGYEYQDARLYASWGVDYLKYDWCATGTANAQETYKTMRDALYAAGRPIVFSICEWGNSQPWIWAKDIGHLWRTTGDITDCYDCQEAYSMGWKYILDFQADLAQYAGPDHWNDPDMLEVGNPGLSLAESRAHFSLWAIMAAPLMAGNDVRNMKPEILEILTNKEVIAIDQDPLGKQGTRFMEQPGKQIWIKELSDNAWAICFFNETNENMHMRIKWPQMYTIKGHFNIRDLWQKKDSGTTDSDWNGTIAPHDVALLKLTPVKK